MGRGGAQKPARRTKIVQELGRVSLGSKLFSFAFVFYVSSLTLPNFIIKYVTLLHFLVFENVYLPKVYRVCPEHLECVFCEAAGVSLARGVASVRRTMLP